MKKTVKLGPLGRRVLSALRAEPGATISTLSDRLQVPREAVKRAVARLTRAQRVRRGRLTLRGKRLYAIADKPPITELDSAVAGMLRQDK